MEVISCSSSQRSEQVETPGGIIMDEFLLDLDVEEATGSELVLKSEPDDLNAEKHSTKLVLDVEETEPLGNNGKGESSPSEPKWLQQDEPIALWVKVITLISIEEFGIVNSIRRC